jgi:hypothetical protein
MMYIVLTVFMHAHIPRPYDIWGNCVCVGMDREWGNVMGVVAGGEGRPGYRKNLCILSGAHVSSVSGGVFNLISNRWLRVPFLHGMVSLSYSVFLYFLKQVMVV